jgi:hypothetical protein
LDLEAIKRDAVLLGLLERNGASLMAARRMLEKAADCDIKQYVQYMLDARSLMDDADALYAEHQRLVRG